MTGILQSLLGSVSSAVAVVTDAYFNLVTLLLPGNGTNGAQNNTFLDSSTNNFTITRNGNTTQGTFSPFSQTGWSNYFDGTDDYLAIADNAVLRPGAGAFTLEAWIWRNASGAAHTIYAKGGASTGIVFQVTSTNVLRFTHTTTNIDSTGTIAANSWVHVAVVREGTGTNQTKLYINGTQDGQGTVSTDFTQTEEVRIGTDRSAAADFNGYISNLRFTKGAALYTGNFTPATSPLTTTSQGASSADVELLTCQSNRFIDNSSNGFAITVNGTPSIQAFSPFAPTAAYSAATVGGSGYFDGTGDYLVTQSSANLAMGSGDVTVECWFYAMPSVNQQWIFDFRTSGSESTTRLYAFIHETTNVLNIGFGTFDDQNAGTPIKNTWNHLAIVRSGSGSNNVSVYLNGSRNLQLTDTTNLSTSTQVHVGRRYSATSSQHMEGYIAGLRALKGTAQYSGSPMSPSVPTAPPTAVTNTQLLLNFTNAGITDATAKNDLETVGNAQISTTQSKFGGSSMYFDGTGDLLFSPASQNYSFPGDFTIECWINTSTISTEGGAYRRLFATGPDAVTSLQIVFSDSLTTSGNISVVTNTFDISGNINAATGAWVHVALARAGSSMRLFVGGVQSGSTLTTTQAFTGGATNGLFIGSASGGTGRYLGYIDDFRITTGYARYTSNFTPPTAAFALQ